MIRSLRRACLVLAGLCAFAQAHAQSAPLARVDSLDADTRPADVPPGYVVTPNGYFHADCVVQVDEGDAVTARGHVRKADGTLRRVAGCRHAFYDRDGVAHPPAGAADTATDDEAFAVPAATFHGWVADSNSNANVTPPAKTMSASWKVPSGPATRGSQVLYFFPGLEASPKVNSILQPVLGWNSYGTQSWTMANWNCCISGTTYVGPSIAVSAGDAITGTMTGSNCASGTGICSDWSIKSADTSNGQSTTFATKAYGQAFNWYFGGVMEVYGISACGQYPSNGSITFTGVKVTQLSGATVTPAWNTMTSGSAPACSYHVAATANQTQITFSH